MRKTLLGAAVAALTALSLTPAAAEPAGDYIVVLKDTSHYSAALSERAVRSLRADPAVAYVEADQIAHTTEQKIANGVSRIFGPANPGLKIGDGVDDRVDADIAVLDTGIDFDHPDLNVVRRVNCVGASTCTENTGDDDNGHGSNVAGIAGALDNDRNTVGVAPGARLWSVKVLNSGGSGNATGIIAGIDWVTANADEIDVANLSLGFNGDVQSVKDAINRAIAKGVVVVVSAGNSRTDVKNQTPANVADAITVSSLSDSDGKPGGTGGGFGWCNQNNRNVDDTLSNFSNFGAGVDLAAPGDCIESTWKDGGRSNYSGTSQAAPHVAGAAAWLTTNGNKPTSRSGVIALRDTLAAHGNFNWSDTSGDNAKEPLLDVSNRSIFPPAPADPGAPTAKFTASCSNDTPTCAFDASASTDPDGSIVSYAWDFGDGTTGSGVKVTHGYPSKDAKYTVTLTVTDNRNQSSKATKDVDCRKLLNTVQCYSF